MGQPSVLKKPSRLEQARLRVDSALTNLESALGQRRACGDSNAKEQLTLDLQKENESLKQQNQHLSDINRRIGNRLVLIIERLKNAARF